MSAFIAGIMPFNEAKRNLQETLANLFVLSLTYFTIFFTSPFFTPLVHYQVGLGMTSFFLLVVIVNLLVIAIDILKTQIKIIKLCLHGKRGLERVLAQNSAAKELKRTSMKFLEHIEEEKAEKEDAEPEPAGPSWLLQYDDVDPVE